MMYVGKIPFKTSLASTPVQLASWQGMPGTSISTSLLARLKNPTAANYERC
jgi:hypothetical protein